MGRKRFEFQIQRRTEQNPSLFLWKQNALSSIATVTSRKKQVIFNMKIRAVVYNTRKLAKEKNNPKQAA